MKQTEDEILRQFMLEQKREVADNGFSRRVMHSLPGTHRHTGWVLNMACTAACLLLFYWLDGVTLLARMLREAYLSIDLRPYLMDENNLLTLAIVVGVLMVLGIGKVCSLEE